MCTCRALSRTAGPNRQDPRESTTLTGRFTSIFQFTRESLQPLFVVQDFSGQHPAHHQDQTPSTAPTPLVESSCSTGSVREVLSRLDEEGTVLRDECCTLTSMHGGAPLHSHEKTDECGEVMMRDDLRGVIALSVRVTAQHNHTETIETKNLTTAKLHFPIISRPSSEVSQSRLQTSQVSNETFIHTETRLTHFRPRSRSRIPLLSRLLNSQKPRDPSDPCVKDRHTFLQALETFFHFFATRARQHLQGNSLVYLKLSTRHSENLMKQRLISV